MGKFWPHRAGFGVLGSFFVPAGLMSFGVRQLLPLHPVWLYAVLTAVTSFIIGLGWARVVLGVWHRHYFGRWPGPIFRQVWQQRKDFS